MFTRYVFTDPSEVSGTIAPDYQLGVAVLARQHTACKAAAEAAAQESALPNQQSTSYPPPANESESHSPASYTS